MPESPQDEQPPNVTRRNIVKRLKEDMKYLQWFLETFPDSRYQDDVLDLKLKLARFVQELA
jgi:hypothetical protein